MNVLLSLPSKIIPPVDATANMTDIGSIAVHKVTSVCLQTEGVNNRSAGGI